MPALIHRSLVMAGLPETLREAAPLLGTSAIALLYRPDECVLARVLADGSLERDGQAIVCDGAFEARAFSRQAEVRWVHREDELGEAVVLVEEGMGDPTVLGGRWSPSGRIERVAPVPVRYVLWGGARSAGTTAGWTRMASARTGDQLVPVPFQRAGQPVYLHGREYVGRVTAVRPSARDDGNVVVVEELLWGLSTEEAAR